MKIYLKTHPIQQWETFFGFIPNRKVQFSHFTRGSIGLDAFSCQEWNAHTSGRLSNEVLCWVT